MDNFKILITEDDTIVNEFKVHDTNLATATDIADSLVKYNYTDNHDAYVFYTC